jgi:hypothetical protein
VELLFSSVSHLAVLQLAEACSHWPHPSKLHGDGFPNHAEPSNDSKDAAPGQALQ